MTVVWKSFLIFPLKNYQKNNSVSLTVLQIELIAQLDTVLSKNAKRQNLNQKNSNRQKHALIVDNSVKIWWCAKTNLKCTLSVQNASM